MALQQQYAAQIHRTYPTLLIYAIELLQGGQYNDVLLINRELLFRFPKVPPAITTLEHEITILRAIQPHLPLPVPRPLYVNLQAEIGAAFMGYPLLPGEPLRRAGLQTLHDETAVAHMARQLAGFLHALHAIPLEKPGRSLPPKDTPQYYTQLYQRIQQHLFPHMRPEARHQVHHHFTAYLNDPAVAAFIPVLRHGDFGSGNILWDREQGTITGVIDFGSAALGDPATDLASLAAGFGDPFLEHCARHYPITPAMRQRMAFYRGTFALQEALFGAENNDPTAFTAGIAAYI